VISTPLRPDAAGAVILLDDSYGELNTSGDRGAAAFRVEGGVSVEAHDMLGKDEGEKSRSRLRHACFPR